MRTTVTVVALLLAATVAHAQTPPITLQVGQTITVDVTTADPSEPPRWVASDPKGLRIVVNQGGYQAEITALAEGTFAATCAADVDLGPGVSDLVGVLIIKVGSGESSGVGFAVGAPR